MCFQIQKYFKEGNRPTVIRGVYHVYIRLSDSRILKASEPPSFQNLRRRKRCTAFLAVVALEAQGWIGKS